MITEEKKHAAIGDAPAEKNVERTKNITRGVTSLTLQNLGTSILGFLFLAILLRFLPAVQYGVYSAITVSTSIGGAAASLGLQFAAARYLSTSRGDHEQARRQARKIILLGAAFSAVASTAFVLFSPYLSLYFAKSESWAWVFDLGALWLFSSALSSVMQGAVQGLKKYTSLATMLFVSRVVMVALTVVGLLAVHSVSVAVLAWVAYSFLTVGWAALVLLKELGHKGKPRDLVSEKTPSTFSVDYLDILKYALPLGVASILSVITSEADVVVVGGYLSPISLGVYNNAVTIAGVLTIVLITPLITALLPEASSSAQNHDEVSNGLRLAIRFVMLAVLPTSLLIAALSRQLLVLFSGGQGYLAGAASLEVISAFYVFVGIQTVIYCLLQAMGKTLQALSICAVTTVADFAVAILLVPSYGIMGAAIARDFAAAIGMIGAIYFGRVYLRRKLDPANFYLKALTTSVVPFVIVWFLSSYLSWRLLTIVPYSAIGGVVFVLLLRSLRVVNGEDRIFFGHALPSFARKLMRPLLGSK